MPYYCSISIRSLHSSPARFSPDTASSIEFIRPIHAHESDEGRRDEDRRQLWEQSADHALMSSRHDCTPRGTVEDMVDSHHTYGSFYWEGDSHSGETFVSRWRINPWHASRRPGRETKRDKKRSWIYWRYSSADRKVALSARINPGI